MRASTSLLVLAVAATVFVVVRGAATFDGASLVVVVLVAATWVAWLVEHARAKRVRR